MSAITWSTTGWQTLPLSIPTQPGSHILQSASQPPTYTQTHTHIMFNMHIRTHMGLHSQFNWAVSDWCWQEDGTKCRSSIRYVVVVYSQDDNCSLWNCSSLLSTSKSPNILSKKQEKWWIWRGWREIAHSSIVKAKKRIGEIILLYAQIPICVDESKELTWIQIVKWKCPVPWRLGIFFCHFKENKYKEKRKEREREKKENSPLSSFNPISLLSIEIMLLTLCPWIHPNTYFLPAYFHWRSHGAEAYPSIYWVKTEQYSVQRLSLCHKASTQSNKHTHNRQFYISIWSHNSGQHTQTKSRLTVNLGIFNYTATITPTITLSLRSFGWKSTVSALSFLFSPQQI